MIGKIKAVNISKEKGVDKHNIQTCEVNMEGLKGDAHAGPWHRQVSLLALESIEKMQYLGVDITYGTFAENITTEGIELHTLPLGTKFKINQVLLELTQIGKKCHHGCSIMQMTGKCIMPTEGIFTKVLQPGTISAEDSIEVIPND
jgi:MOSC domain-containing protein YiiM